MAQLAAADVNDFCAEKFWVCEELFFLFQRRRHARAGMTNEDPHVARRIGGDFRSQSRALIQNEHSAVAAWTALYKAFAGSRSRVAFSGNMSERRNYAKPR